MTCSTCRHATITGLVWTRKISLTVHATKVGRELDVKPVSAEENCKNKSKETLKLHIKCYNYNIMIVDVIH